MSQLDHPLDLTDQDFESLDKHRSVGAHFLGKQEHLLLFDHPEKGFHGPGLLNRTFPQLEMSKTFM